MLKWTPQTFLQVCGFRQDQSWGMVAFRSLLLCIKTEEGGLSGGAVVESLPANAGNTGSSPGLGRSHMPRSN